MSHPPILPGTCQQCGSCCLHINLGRVAQFKEEQKEYIRAHGVIEDQGFFLIPFKCPHLRLRYRSDMEKSPDQMKEIEKVENRLKFDIELKDDEECSVFYNDCDIHDTKPKICQKFDGTRYKNHTIFWVPRNCSMAVK